MSSEQPPITRKVTHTQNEIGVGVGVFQDATGAVYSYIDRGMLRLSGPTDKWPPRSPSSVAEFVVNDDAVIEKLPSIKAPEDSSQSARHKLSKKIISIMLGR